MVSARRILAALALPAAAATAVAVLPNTAQAATAADGSVTLCSDGSYGSVLVFPERGYLSTVIVYPGECRTWDNSAGVEQVFVQKEGGGSIGSFQLNGSAHVTVTTFGTASNPNYYIG